MNQTEATMEPGPATATGRLDGWLEDSSGSHGKAGVPYPNAFSSPAIQSAHLCSRTHAGYIEQVQVSAVVGNTENHVGVLDWICQDGIFECGVAKIHLIACEKVRLSVEEWRRNRALAGATT